MKTNQHIVFLTPGFAKSEEDSTTIPALQIFLKSLRKTIPNAKLTLLAFQFPFTNSKYYWHDIEIIPLNGQNKRLKKLWIWKKAYKTLENLHKSQKIDITHSFWIGECSRIGEKFSKKYKSNHIVTVMGQDASIKNSYTKSLINSSAKIITLSKNHQRELLSTCGLNSTIIPWFIDVTEFPSLKENTIDILGVGSLNSIKNYSDFIDIISSVVKTKKNLNVAIIGNGILLTKLQKKIKTLQLENTISLLGELPRAKVLEKMTQSNILLHTSHYESFGFVFLEALYSGMKIISYNVGIGKNSKHWHIGNNKKKLIKICAKSISISKENKKRIEISSKQETINAYLTLYNE